MKYLSHKVYPKMFDLETIAVITKLATRYGIETAALLAVVDTESAGVAFWNVGRTKKPAIRFEGHYFYRLVPANKQAEAVKLGLASSKPGAVKNPNSYSARYDLLARAIAFDEIAALQSVSWGLGQVMGENWNDLGYASVKALVTSCQTVEGQVELMLKFIKHNGLIKYINAHNWAKFAERYNGKNFRVNHYDTKMASAHKLYSTSSVPEANKADIRLMQTMLNKLGTYELEITGFINEATDTALRDFQLKNALKTDGVYGPLTRETMEKKYRALGTQRVDFIGKVSASSGVVGTTLSEAANNIQPLAAYSQLIQYAFFALIIVGVALTTWALISGNKAKLANG